jgi:hypothetical protein
MTCKIRLGIECSLCGIQQGLIAIQACIGDGSGQMLAQEEAKASIATADIQN